MKKLTDQRGGRRGIMGARRGRGKQRNTSRILMGIDNGRGCTAGVGGAGEGRAIGKKVGQL